MQYAIAPCFNVANRSQYSPDNCGMTGLNESVLHRHLSLYHSMEPNIEAECPLCHDVSKQAVGGLYVHFHNSHGAPEARDPPRPPFGAVTRVIGVRGDVLG